MRACSELPSSRFASEPSRPASEHPLRSPAVKGSHNPFVSPKKGTKKDTKNKVIDKKVKGAKAPAKAPKGTKAPAKKRRAKPGTVALR